MVHNQNYSLRLRTSGEELINDIRELIEHWDNQVDDSALNVSYLTYVQSKKAAEVVPNRYLDGQLDSDSSAKVTVCAECPVTSSQ